MRKRRRPFALQLRSIEAVARELGRMMCEWGNVKPVCVKIPAEQSHTGRAYWKEVGIDACIADIVEALQAAGIDMRGSCCGHGKEAGSILLADGRILRIETVQKERCDE
jgi:hypothetical protein